jgi:hypothetical protein
MTAKERIYELTEEVRIGTGEKAEVITEVIIKRKLKYLRGCAVRAGADGAGGVSINFEFDTLIDLASKMVGLPVSTIEEFSEKDQSEIIQEANSFLFKHLGTGKAP